VSVFDDLPAVGGVRAAISEVDILRLQPGDVLVLKTPHRLCKATRDNLLAAAKAVLKGRDVRVLLLEDGITPVVIRLEEEGESEAKGKGIATEP